MRLKKLKYNRKVKFGKEQIKMTKKLFSAARKPIVFIWLCFFLSSCTFVIRSPFEAPKNKKPNIYRGVYHVHSNFSHDSKTTLDYISKTAKKAGLDFVIITDHNNDDAKKNLKAPAVGEPLLIVGTEISTWHDGHLGVIGAQDPPFNIERTEEIVDIVHRQGGYAIPAHPYSLKKPWTNWEIPNYDGMEVFCFSDFFYQQKFYNLTLKALLFSAQDFLKSVLTVNPENLKRWDRELSSGKHFAGFGAVDAHIKFRLGNFIPENLLLSFQSVTMYVLSDAKEERKIIDALARGNGFIAFEVFGLANDFSFSAARGNKTYGPGESVPLESSLQLQVKSPKPARIKLIHEGAIIAENTGKALSFDVKDAGYYRVEVYLEDKLWIISNPIYVEEKPAA